MVDIQVDIVQPQILQAGVDHLFNVPLAGNTGGNFLLGAWQELGGNHHILPLREILKRPAQVLLAGAALVADGGVEEVDPQFQPPLDNFPGMFLIQRPAVLAVSRVAEAHASHADAGHRQVRISEFCVLHSNSSCFLCFISSFFSS